MVASKSKTGAKDPVRKRGHTGGGSENVGATNGRIRRSGRERSTVKRFVPPTSMKASKRKRSGDSTRYHITPSNEWDWLVKKMRNAVSNTLEWRSGTPLPRPPRRGGCWLLPCKDDTAVEIGAQREALAAAGWKLLTCPGERVARIGNKANLVKHAAAIGMLDSLPRHYSSPASATYPCMLKATTGEHGRDVFVVKSAAEVAQKTGGKPFDKGKWLLQEICAGRVEHATSLLVKEGVIHDAICTNYEYDCGPSGVYVWPFVKEVRADRAHATSQRARARASADACTVAHRRAARACPLARAHSPAGAHTTAAAS